MTLGSGMVSGPKHHYHLSRVPQQYLTTPPDFVRLLSLNGIAVKALSWIVSMYFLLFDGGSPRLVKNAKAELAMKPLHPISIGNTFAIQLFLTHCSHISSYFSNLCWCAQSKFSLKGTVNSITKTFFALMDQMTISGRFVINAISVGNIKLCFKSVVTCQSVQPSSNDGLHIFLRSTFEIYIYIYIYIYTRGSYKFCKILYILVFL